MGAYGRPPAPTLGEVPFDLDAAALATREKIDAWSDGRGAERKVARPRGALRLQEIEGCGAGLVDAVDRGIRLLSAPYR